MPQEIFYVKDGQRTPFWQLMRDYSDAWLSENPGTSKLDFYSGTSEETGISTRTLQRYINPGIAPNRGNFLRLIKAFGYKEDDFSQDISCKQDRPKYALDKRLEEIEQLSAELNRQAKALKRDIAKKKTRKN